MTIITNTIPWEKAYLANGEPENALHAFQEADRLKPNQDYVLDKWAEALLQLHRLKESLAMYTRIPINLRKDYILRNMGHLYYLSNEYQKAIETLQLAVQKNRRNHNGHYYLGICFRDKGQLSLAVRELGEAIRLKQKHYSRPFPEAKEILDTLLAENPTLANEQSRSGLQCGIVSEYKGAGYGFIETDFGRKIFFHITDCLDRECAKVGSHVEFEEEKSAKGPKAVRVKSIHHIEIKK